MRRCDHVQWREMHNTCRVPQTRPARRDRVMGSVLSWLLIESRVHRSVSGGLPRVAASDE